MISKVKVSIIIPVFNTEKYLEKCLQSVLNQKLDKIEVICVDNGSTDGSIDILKKYSIKYPNFKIINHPNGNQGDARNIGIQQSKGDYIGFVDSDDYVHPEMFELLYQKVKNHGSDIGICNIQTFSEKSVLQNQLIKTKFLDFKDKFKIKQNFHLLRNTTIANKIFSRNLIMKNDLRFLEGVFHEDQYFVVIALLKSRYISSVSKSLYYYRKIRKNSTSENISDNAFDIFEVWKKIKSYKYLTNDSTLAQLEISRTLMIYSKLNGYIRKSFFKRMKNIFGGAEIEKKFTFN